jgi:hypothetical protein
MLTPGSSLATFRSACATAWLAASPAERRDLAEKLTRIERLLAALPSNEAEIQRWKDRQEWVEQLRHDAGTWSRFLLAAYEHTYPTLAAGPPRLTWEMATGSIQLSAFKKAEAQGMRWSGVPAVEQQQYRAKLQSQWPTLPAAERARIASAPLRWMELHLGWPRLSETQRERMRARWRKELGVPRSTPPPAVGQARPNQDTDVRFVPRPYLHYQPRTLYPPGGGRFIWRF